MFPSENGYVIVNMHTSNNIVHKCLTRFTYLELLFIITAGIKLN